MEKESEFTNRLKEIMQIREMTQTELANRTGISKGSISQYMHGWANPSADRIYRMSRELNINESWLMGFDVPMERTNEKDTILIEIENVTKDMREEQLKRILEYAKFISTEIK